MTEQTGEKRAPQGEKDRGKGIAALYLLLNVVLNATQSNGRISRFLAMCSITLPLLRGINFAGRTIVIPALTIANLPGVAGRNFLFARMKTDTLAWTRS
jgi:hypothetical protein